MQIKIKEQIIKDWCSKIKNNNLHKNGIRVAQTDLR